MKSAFDWKQNKWLTETVDRLPKNDLFFGSNYADPGCGILLGDGATGTNLWPDRDKLHLEIGHTDIWDDTTDDPDSVFCCGEKDDETKQRKAGKIELDFEAPVFDMMFQQKQQARLTLADATVRFSAVTPFSELEGECFAENVAGVTVLHMKGTFSEETAPSVTLSRWGSRVLWRWYDHQPSDMTLGLSGTSSSVSTARNARGYIVQKLNGTIFCLGLDIQSEEKLSCERLHSRAVRMTFPRQKEHEFTLFYHVAFGEDETEALAACDQALDRAVSMGKEALYLRHAEDWRAFWNRSGIRIPDDYLENLFYLYLYFLNSEGRGTWAPHFTSGVWGSYYDYLPWVYYFFYNMQQLYHPLGALGHTELEENYLRMRHDGMANARRFAREVKGVDRGIFIHDVTDRYGRGATYDKGNVTPGPQTAMAMWKHYRYTGDEKFLEEMALPMMRETAEYYLAILKKGEDGRYHTYHTTAYEGHNETTDSVTDRVMIEVLFRTLASLPNEPKAGEYREVLENLSDFIRTMPCEDELDHEGRLKGGLGKGEKLYGEGKLLAYGYQPDPEKDTISFCGERTVFGNPVREMFLDKRKVSYGFPDLELSPVFPGSLVGLSDRGTELFDIMRNQALFHAGLGGCMMWCLIPVYLARLGMSRYLLPCLHECADDYQVYPNGMGAEGGEKPHDCDRYYETVHWDDSSEKVHLDAQDYAHFDFETVPVITEALTEALLQSFEGVLRICPTYPLEDGPVFFDLLAEGGFRVTAEIGRDQYLFTVDCLRGEDGLVCLPDGFDPEKAYCYRNTGSGFEPFAPQIRNEKADRLLVLPGKEGCRYFLSSVPLNEIETEAVPAERPNMQAKQSGRAILGAFSSRT